MDVVEFAFLFLWYDWQSHDLRIHLIVLVKKKKRKIDYDWSTSDC